jgi:cell division septation protein DedD
LPTAPPSPTPSTTSTPTPTASTETPAPGPSDQPILPATGGGIDGLLLVGSLMALGGAALIRKLTH